MGVTPTYQLPYPELGELPDGPSAVRNLATRTDQVLNGLSRPAVRIAMRNTTVTLPNVTNVILGQGWPPMSGDLGDACGITFGGGVYTVSERGLYRVTASLYVTGGGTASHRIIGNILVNGTYYYTVANQREGQAGATVVVSGPLLLEPGDYIQLAAWQGSGATAQISGDRWTWWAIELVHRIPA